jgi:hypothetical protein
MSAALVAMCVVCGVPIFVEPQTHLTEVAWPSHAFVTLPQGWVKPIEQMFVLENGRPIAAQIEVAGRWPDGSPKWVHVYASFRYAAGKPAAYEFEKRPPPPTALPKSPLTVVDQPGGITVSTGAIVLTVPRPFGGVSIADAGGTPIVGGPGGPGLVDDRTIEWHARFDQQAEIVVEQQGPAQVTIKCSGWYQSEQKRVPPFCRFVTRITAFANSPMVQFDQATIFADDMHKHAIAELPFRFSVPGVQGHTSGPLTGKLDERSGARYFAQFSADRMVTIDHPGAETSPAPETSGSYGRSPGWFVAETAAARVALLTKDFWQKCPKEVKIGRDELVYYAWPKHGALARPDDDALRLHKIYKFQCFHTGQLLDSRLPGDYVTALELQTDTTECKADYARAANLQGIAMRNQFALVVLPRRAGAPQDDAHVAGLHGLYVQNPNARVSPTAVAVSRVLGPVAASGRDYPDQRRAVRDGMIGYAGSIARWGDFGWAIYGNTHHAELMHPEAAGIAGGRPSLHRVWNNNHYQHVSTAWRLYALDGDPELLQCARVFTDNYASVGQVRYDPMTGYTDGKGVHHPGPSIKYRSPGGFFHCKALVPWGGRDYGMNATDVDAGLTGHWSDPSALLFAWLMDADRWAKDGYDLWLANVKFPTGGNTREVNTTLVHAITAYEYQPTDALLAAIKTMGKNLIVKPIVEQHQGPIWEPTWLSRYYELIPEDEAFKKYLLASADALGTRHDAMWTLALSATAYRITGDDKYLRRHAGSLARAARSVFYDPRPDKRWDRTGFSPGPLQDGHFMLQWHRFLAALRDAAITSLPPPPEPGHYLHYSRGTKIVIAKDSADPLAIRLQGSTLSGGDIHATALEVLAPAGTSLLKIDRLPMSAARLTNAVQRPSSWTGAVEEYSVKDAGTGLYSVVITGHQFGAFQPLTSLPECEVLSTYNRPQGVEPWFCQAQITRGYLLPLVPGRFVFRFTAAGQRDGTHVALFDRAGKALISQWIRAGDSIEVTVGGAQVRTAGRQQPPAGGEGPWLLDSFSDRSGYLKMEISGGTGEPILYGSHLKHLELIRDRMRK